MKRAHLRHLALGMLYAFLLAQSPAFAQSDGQPRGAYQLPYVRYEAEAATSNGGHLQQSPQFIQSDIAVEASDQKYISLVSTGASVEWVASQAAQGLNLRFTLPDNSSGSLNLYVNNNFVKTINLSSYWAYQYFTGEDPSQQPGGKTFMRFDEVHFRLDNPINAGDKIRLQKDNSDGLTYGVDFIELEPVPAALAQPANYLSVTSFGAVANDQGDDLAAFNQCISAAAAQGRGVYIPAGRFLLSDKLMLTANNIKIQGAGVWYTELYFSTDKQFYGGIMGRTGNAEISHFSMNTANNDRLKYDEANARVPQDKYKIYKGFMGTYGNGSRIHDIWLEHFECGFWLGGYDPPFPVDVTTNLVISKCRIRNNYADGVNFCQGTSGSIVEQCSLRNNGDDGLAIWPAKDAGNNVACRNNIFRNNTIEDNWRAGGVAIFGGTGHEVHHNIIKDGVAGSAIRFTNDFSGFTFEYPGDLIRVYENTITGCGTSYDLWNQKRGAIELYANTGIFNIQFDNNTILRSQRDGIQIYGNNIHHLTFNNTTIDGTGLDPVTRDADGGFGLYVQAGSQTATFNNLAVSNAESGTYINRNTSFQLIIQNTNIPVTGIRLEPATDTTIGIGQTAILKAAVLPADATNKNISWSSSNPGVVMVDASGRITAIATGSATIAATTQSGAFRATRTITVQPCTGLSIPRTATAPVIDQTIDATWSQATAQPIRNPVLGALPGDYNGRWRALYDATNLYLLVEVTDAVKINDSGASWWEDDGIELFIDGDNSKGAVYDGRNDFQLGFRWNDNTIHTGGSSVTRTNGISYRQYATASGYTLEAAIPWATIGATPAAGKPIGLDIQVDDDDNNGARDAQVAAFATTGLAYQDPRVFGTVYLQSCDGSGDNSTPTPPTPVDSSGKVFAGRITSPVVVNGQLNEAAWRLSRNINKTTVGAPNNTAVFGALWDDNNLYIGVQVQDGALFNDSPDAWDNDGIELFIDANNNKGNTYDSHDNQLIKGWNSSSVFMKTGLSGVQHAWAPIAGGYSVEISIPWSQLGITPTADLALGFDIAYDDDDDDGGRDAQAVWFGDVNDYQSTVAFGQLVLSDGTAALVNNTTQVKAALEKNTMTASQANPIALANSVTVEKAALRIVPNPALGGQAQVSIVAVDGGMSAGKTGGMYSAGISGTGLLQIFSTSGHLVHSERMGLQTTLRLGHLPKGIYVIQYVNGGMRINGRLMIP